MSTQRCPSSVKMVNNIYWRRVVMLKKSLVPFVLGLLMLGPAFAETKPVGPVVKPLDRSLEDVGCVYFDRKAKNNAFPILLSDPEGTVMYIDGEVRQLTLDDKYEGKNSSRYTVGEYQILVDYGRVKQHEGGTSFGNAKITVQKQGRSTVIKAKGGCGC
jgi:hypothetical protein